jgi:hypothetical protein
MSRDIAGRARAFGVDRASELRAFFECKVSSDDIGLNGRRRSDVDTVGRDVSLEIPIDGDFAGCDGGVHARSGAGDKTMTFQIDSPFEQSINHHIFTCRELSLYRQCRAAVHGLYFHSVLVIWAS